MGLLQKIEDDLKAAFRGGDKNTTAVLRMVKTALQNAEIAKRGQTKDREAKLTEEEARAAVKRMIKQTKDAQELFTKGGRPDLVAKSEEELKVLEKYLGM